MSRLKDNLRMHWPLLVGLVLFLPAAWMYYSLGRWEEYAVSAAMGLYGFVSTAFADEVASWTGRYGWTYQSFWTYPPTYVRFMGIAVQLGVLMFGFR